MKAHQSFFCDCLQVPKDLAALDALVLSTFLIYVGPESSQSAKSKPNKAMDVVGRTRVTVVSLPENGYTNNSRSEDESSILSTGTQVPFNQRISCEFRGKLSTGKSLNLSDAETKPLGYVLHT